MLLNDCTGRKSMAVAVAPAARNPCTASCSAMGQINACANQDTLIFPDPNSMELSTGIAYIPHSLNK